jgi:hypothetical protein
VTVSPSTAPATAVAGFEAWLGQTDASYDLAIDGVAVNWGPMFGMVHVNGADSFQLITSESLAIWTFERTSSEGRVSRSNGVAYEPKAADLTSAERIQDALAASSGWVDSGTNETDGQTLHDLVAGTTPENDAGLTSGDPPFGSTDPEGGKVDAWVTPNGVPVELDYTSSGLSLAFHVEEPITPIAGDVAPLVRHKSKAYGYSFMAASGTGFKAAGDGEFWNSGPIAFLTYCKPRAKGDNLQGWATDGNHFYAKLFGQTAGVLYSEVAPNGVGVDGTVDVAVSTYTGTSADFKGKAVASAAFGTKSHWCDVQAVAPSQHADEAHALLDRLLVTLQVTG